MVSCVLAAKMMVYLDSSKETKAAELAAALDESLENRTIQVNLDDSSITSCLYETLNCAVEYYLQFTEPYLISMWRFVNCQYYTVPQKSFHSDFLSLSLSPPPELHRGPGLPSERHRGRLQGSGRVLPWRVSQALPLHVSVCAPRIRGEHQDGQRRRLGRNGGAGQRDLSATGPRQDETRELGRA